MGILEEVNASYEKLSPVQKRIADFIFKYPDQVCFYSLKELSETLGVTEVTILRFTKKIGVQSFVGDEEPSSGAFADETGPWGRFKQDRGPCGRDPVW